MWNFPFLGDIATERASNFGAFPILDYQPVPYFFSFVESRYDYSHFMDDDSYVLMSCKFGGSG